MADYFHWGCAVNISTMLHDLFQSLLSKPATEPFPNPEPNEPERLRGKLHWDPERCTGCQLCIKDCPADALKLFTIDKKAKEFVMRYDVGRCTFCAQCVENCRFDCISMSNTEWALASESKAPFIIYYGDEAHVEQVLAGKFTGEPEPEE
jgi:formate hydrogenlyase subunit 6/NADH:ubiquinone oxidoreductase subunit I